MIMQKTIYMHSMRFDIDNSQVLKNPTESDFSEAAVLEENDEMVAEIPQIIPKNQLMLDLPEEEVKVSMWDRLIHTLQKREEEIELMPYWRNVAAPLAMVSGIASILLSLYIGVLRFNQLPPKIPLYYIEATSSWEQIDKTIALAAPILLFIFNFLVWRLGFLVFRFDRRLSIASSWILLLVNFLISLALLQVYSLIT